MSTDKKYPPLPEPTATAFGDEYEAFDRNGKAMGKAYSILPYFSADQMHAYADAATALQSERHAQEIAARGVPGGLPKGWVVYSEGDISQTISVVAPNGCRARYREVTTNSSKNHKNVLQMLIQDVLATAPQPAAQQDHIPDAGKMVAQSERKPMDTLDIDAVYESATNQHLRPQDRELVTKYTRAVEAFHDIKKGGAA